MPQILNETLVVRGRITESDKAKLPKGVLCRGVWAVANLDKLNQNNRIYERDVFEKAVLQNEEIQGKMKARTLFGHAEHPDRTQSDLQLTSHVITGTFIKEDNGVDVVFQNIDVLDTPCGRIVNTLLEAECAVGVSTRAEGDLEEREDKDTKKKYMRVIPESYRYVTTDFTADPSTYGTKPMNVVREIKNELKSGKLTNNERVFATAILEAIEKATTKESIIPDDKDNDEAKIKKLTETETGTIEEFIKKELIKQGLMIECAGAKCKVIEIKEHTVSVVFDNGGSAIITGPTPVSIAPDGLVVIPNIAPMIAQPAAEIPQNNAPAQTTNDDLGLEGIMDTPEEEDDTEAEHEASETPEEEAEEHEEEEVKEVESEETEEVEDDLEESKKKANEGNPGKDDLEAALRIAAQPDKYKEQDITSAIRTLKEEPGPKAATRQVRGALSSLRAHVANQKTNESKVNESYQLWVYSKKLDKDNICKLVGKRSDGSGVDMKQGIQDISFTFKTEAEAKAAAEKIKGMKGYSTEIFADEDVKESKKIKESNDEDVFVKVTTNTDSGRSVSVIHFYKDGSKWAEELFAGDLENVGYKRHMGYLTAEDLVDWTQQDFGNAKLISEDEANEIADNVNESKQNGKLKLVFESYDDMVDYLKDAFKKMDTAPHSKLMAALPSSVLNERKAETSLHKELREAKVKEALTRAESEKAVELLSVADDKIRSFQESVRIESKTLYKKLQEATTNESKEVQALRTLLETSVKTLQTIKKELDDTKKTFEQKVTEAQNECQKKIVNEYINMKATSSALKLPSTSRALLEKCSTVEEVDSVFEDVRDALRRGALLPSNVENISVTITEKKDPVQNQISKAIGSVFDSMV